MNLKHPRNKHRQHGSMLIRVLFIMVVLGALMAAIATLTSQSSQQLVYEVQALKARLVAEAVLEKQIYLQLDSIDALPAHKKDSRLALADCSAYIDEPLLSTNTQPKKINIIAIGTCSTGQLTVIRNIEVEVIQK